MNSTVALAFLACAGMCSPLAAELRLGFAWGDRMVLQAGKPLGVSGMADPGQAVTVEFGAGKASGRADSAGRWTVKLPAPKASSVPADLVVKAGRETLACRDVLVGQVWLCSGQSNMDWPLGRTPEKAATAANSDRPLVRVLDLSGAANHDTSKPWGEDALKANVPERYFKGAWQVLTPEAAPGFSAVAQGFAREMQQATGEPVGIVVNAVGGSPIESWLSPDSIKSCPEARKLASGWPDNKLLHPWVRRRSLENTKGVTGKPVSNHTFAPAFLHKAGIEPISSMAFAGVLWYQGESNSNHPLLWGPCFVNLVQGWRRTWGKDLPVVYVQLAALAARGDGEDWPTFREVQRRLLPALQPAGMVVTIDVGDKGNVHPGRKQEVGRRLMLQARRLQGADVVADGPLFAKAEPSGAAIRVRFASAKGLATSDGAAPAGFEVAGPAGKFIPAEAAIDGDSIVVRSASVPHPVRVRYAWAPWPEPAANLVNGDGLPASPFDSGWQPK